MKIRGILFTGAMAMFLTGCLETPEQAEARRTQFNGKTVVEVSEIIGKPTTQNKSKAVWMYQNSFTRLVNEFWYIQTHSPTGCRSSRM